MKLLCTDLDRTLIPNGAEAESPLARPVLWQLLRSQGMALAYVSGRDLGRVVRAIEEHALQIPDVIVADVGTSIYVPGASHWELHDPWQTLIGLDWNGLDSVGIGESLRGFAEMREQEPDRQTRYKRSYYLPLDTDTSPLHERLLAHLQGLGIRASLVFSDDPEKNVKLLDILPVHATKLDAIVHVQKLLDVDNGQCLFSGDSGNDVTALASHLLSVTVANADVPTQAAVRRLADINGTQQGTYQAIGGLSLAGGQELNGNYAAGIVEGLVHFRPEWREMLLSPSWVDEAVGKHSPASGYQSRRA